MSKTTKEPTTPEVVEETTIDQTTAEPTTPEVVEEVVEEKKVIENGEVCTAYKVLECRIKGVDV
jgi:hypothetical protein